MAAAAIAGLAVAADMTRPATHTWTAYNKPNANTREGRVPTYQEPNANTREGRVPTNG